MTPGSVNEKLGTPTIPQFFQERHILITGATGFMGKVLLCKLLRSCPGLGKIYVLIRSSRGKDAVTRLKEMLTLSLFDDVRKDPGFREDKIVVVEGDITALGLGLSEADRATILENVSIVFHVAASVRFNEPLTDAILMNTRGTREVVELCLKMKQLVALLHVSTTYSNCEHNLVEEAVYLSPMDWRDAIRIAEELDPAIVNTFATKCIGEKPNTYTFTKCLAEHVIWDHRHVLPIIIFRPSIVVSTWKDPVPGWLDNLNGPVGVMMGAGHGVLRVSMCDPDVVPDYMPVDIAIRAILVAVYQKGISNFQEPEEYIFNCASTSSSISNKQLIELGMKLVKEVPLTTTLWYPTDDVTTSRTYFTVKSWFAHLLPAIAIDFALRASGREPRLLKIQRKIFIAILALSYFTCQEWKFKNEKFMKLLSFILPEDKVDFDFDFSDIDPSTYFRQCVLGARVYLLNDPIENIPLGRKRFQRLYWGDKIVRVASILLALWLLDLPRRMNDLWTTVDHNYLISL
ncbi:putative fatty acyl-CoA reductase CG5065 [Macrosteles quadrilineatus]|uniref:putative fatty acyl-CoA reductase CG5065 n=1 Tax=Macrosteles quadrilineatus TaxID=74068 RepID=UPI0023E0F0DE|nr:putative fatty acyl-CoA reductase CG5065 [Macrosteles quadrilineatus]